MIRGIYILAFIVSMLLIVNLACLGKSYISIFYVLVFVAMAIGNLGYLEIINATTLDAALLANKITYLGGCYIPFYTLMTISELCKQKIPRKYSLFCFFASSVVFGLSCTIGHSDLYYSNISLVTEKGVAYLLKDYGPLHIFYTLLLTGYLVATLGVVIHTLLARKDVSYKTALLSCAMLCTGMAAYMIERVFDIKIELVGFAYVLNGCILLALLRRIRMYDVSTVLSESLSEAKEYGFITFNAKKDYIGSNETAKHLFKELEQIKIDTPIEQMNTPLFTLIKDRINVLNESGITKGKHIKCDELEIKCSVKYIKHQRTNKIIGYYVEMVDDTEERKYVRLLNNYNSQLEQDVAEKTNHIEQMQDDIILSMADIVENRDSSTGGHIRRTSEGVRILVNKLMELDQYSECEDAFYERVIKAAPLHDFGKIAIDDSILKKPGRFTEEEFEKMKEHTSKGAKIVGKILFNVDDTEFQKIAVNVAHYHHEKWNGRGYPMQLKEEEIPFEARIMALADVFDALVSKRCYKNRYTYEEAFKIIEDSLGSHFDPELGKIFLLCRPELERAYDLFEEQELAAI